MAGLRRTRTVVTAGLLVGAAAVVGLAVGGGERSAVVAGPPERGMAVDPAAYLGPEHRRELARSGLTVYAPTWLPDWTARATFFVLGPGTQPDPDHPSWWMTWRVSWTESAEPVLKDWKGDVRLQVSGNASRESLRRKASGLDLAVLRAAWGYEIHPCGESIELNRACLLAGKARTYVYLEEGFHGNVACRGGEEVSHSAAYASFLNDGVTYSVMLEPGPGCWNGRLTLEDLVAVADSLAPADVGERSR